MLSGASDAALAEPILRQADIVQAQKLNYLAREHRMVEPSHHPKDRIRISEQFDLVSRQLVPGWTDHGPVRSELDDEESDVNVALALD